MQYSNLSTLFKNFCIWKKKWWMENVARSNSASAFIFTGGFTCSLSTIRYTVERRIQVDSMVVSGPGLAGAKHTQTMTLPPPRFTFSLRFYSWNAVFGLCQTYLLIWCTNNEILDSSIQRTIFQKSWALSTFKTCYQTYRQQKHIGSFIKCTNLFISLYEQFIVLHYLVLGATLSLSLREKT